MEGVGGADTATQQDAGSAVDFNRVVDGNHVYFRACGNKIIVEQHVVDVRGFAVGDVGAVCGRGSFRRASRG